MVFNITNEVIMKIRYQIENQKEMDKARRDVNSLGEGPLRGAGGQFVSKKSVVDAVAAANKQEKADAAAVKAEQAKTKAQQTSTRAMYGLLGSMFLLAAISSSIMAMASPAMDLAGVFDIISMIFILLFLPAIIYLIPYLLKILKWVNSMSHESKLFIGIALLVVMAMALIAGALIAVVVAMAGLGGALAGIAAIVGLTVGEFLLLVAAIVAVIAIVVALLAVFDDWVNRNRSVIYESLGAKTPEQKAKMAAGFASVAMAIPDSVAATNPGFGVVNWIAEKMAGSAPAGSTNNQWSWSTVMNIINGRDSNYPKIDTAAGGIS